MKTKPICFKLTEPQYRILCPLFRKVDKAWGSDHPGAILLQAKGYEVTGGFVPEKYAKKISEMLEKLQEEDEDANAL